MGRWDVEIECRRCHRKLPIDEPRAFASVQLQTVELVTSPWRSEYPAKRTRMVGPRVNLCPDCAREAQEMIVSWCEEEA